MVLKLILTINLSLLFFSLEYKGNILNTFLSYEKILTGWKHQPFSSLNSLYDSICVVYDNLNPFSTKDNSKENIQKKNQWFYYRNSETKKVRQKMEDLWEIYFNKYHENVFLSVDGKIPDLNEPTLFSKILREFPWSIYKTVHEKELFSETTICGPTEETLLDLSFTDDLNPDEYYPSKYTMKEFFLGKYLNEFSKAKNYLFKDESDDRLKSLMRIKEDALELGQLIKWKFSSLFENRT